MLNLELAHSIYADRQREIESRLRTRVYRAAVRERDQAEFVVRERPQVVRQPVVTLDGVRSR